MLLLYSLLPGIILLGSPRRPVCCCHIMLLLRRRLLLLLLLRFHHFFVFLPLLLLLVLGKLLVCGNLLHRCRCKVFLGRIEPTAIRIRLRAQSPCC